MPTPTAVWQRGFKRRVALLVLLLLAALGLALSSWGQTTSSDPLAVLGYNELGMHCMNQDFSEICILPPYNTLRAEIIDRSGSEPRIITSGVTVRYAIPSNTRSADKTNFWLFAKQLFGVDLAPNLGLTGNGLAGTLRVTSRSDWEATGIPITPVNDFGQDDPYPLAQITVIRNGVMAGQTRTVVPVSSEISCNLCHSGASVADDILRKHDRLHNTRLQQAKPVLCASCHADPALNAPGQAGVSSLSHAMHRAHAERVADLRLDNSCYACHPGFRAQCQRDVHLSNGVTCTTCHGDMLAVANTNRRPWIDEPRCSSCHQRSGFQFEETGKLYKESRGHEGVTCAACHGAPHAITPTASEADNLQAINYQNHPGKLDQCTVCHRQRPNETFPHRR